MNTSSKAFLTKLLDDLKIQGKLDQDALVIGRGVKEQITFKVGEAANAPAIRFTPGTAGERTFTMLGTSSHPVFDEETILRPYPKPINEFTNQWVLPAEDVIWISDEFKDEDFPGTHYIMYIGGPDGPMPNKWRVHTIGSGSGELGFDWNGTSTPDFLGAQENVTWSNGEASAYPESPDDWSTSGYQGVKPEIFTMSNTEGSPTKIEYTDDGVTWNSLDAGGSSEITFEPISFTSANLSEGKLTIHHNFGSPNVLCLGYTVTPKNITYSANDLVLDYSDHDTTVTGVVWFINSKQSMLTV